MSPNTRWKARLLGVGVAATIGCAAVLSACGGTSHPAAKATVTKTPVAVTTPAASPRSTTTMSTSASSSASAGTTLTMTAFLSPTRNIGCELNYQRSGVADGTYCQTISPPQSATLSTNGTYTTCTGPNCVGNPGENTPILAYGDSTQVGPFTCASASTGVTCTAAGGGFTISRSGITAAGTGAPVTAPAASNPATTMSALAGTWSAHEANLVITGTGAGHLQYADLNACPSCSLASAPVGTMDFALTSITNGVGSGNVTGSSDSGVYAVGAPVTASLTPANPGEFLQLVVSGTSSNYCNSTSTGQCGA